MSDATHQHIALLAAKRARLLEAQLDAESQYLASVIRQHRSGDLTYIDLALLYDGYRDASGPVPGFSKRWTDAGLPHPSRLSHARAAVRCARESRWEGAFPLSDDTVVPIRGVSVVYLLFDRFNVPCYVGSTIRLRQRLKEHARDGKVFIRWQAHACSDRADAYRIESEWLARYQPYLNSQGASDEHVG